MATPFSLTSPAFPEGLPIPSQYTCDGEQQSPPLIIMGVPEGTKSLALIMTDPDIPQELKQQHGITEFVHWVLLNIDPVMEQVPEGAVGIGVEGSNGAGKTGYMGPCPPPQYEPHVHRYVFTLYALDRMLDLGIGASREDVENMMQGHVLAHTQLTGTYERTQ